MQENILPDEDNEHETTEQSIDRFVPKNVEPQNAIIFPLNKKNGRVVFQSKGKAINHGLVYIF